MILSNTVFEGRNDIFSIYDAFGLVRCVADFESVDEEIDLDFFIRDAEELEDSYRVILASVASYRDKSGFRISFNIHPNAFMIGDFLGTSAHEIGHIVLKHGKKQESLFTRILMKLSSSKRKLIIGEKEEEANIFAQKYAMVL